MRTFKRIVNEFWIQTLASICWGMYKASLVSDDKVSVFIGNFSACLFLLSWMFGQVIRVRKQQKIEDEFGVVKSDLKTLIEKLEGQTRDLIGYSTGSDSIAYFLPMLRENFLELSLMNVSKYPVFDVAGEWIDLDEPIDIEKMKLWTRHPYQFGDIYPNKIAMQAMRFDLTGKDQLRINIFGQTRNKGMTQQIRVKRIDVGFSIAYKISSETFNETKIPNTFPGFDATKPDDVFN